MESKGDLEVDLTFCCYALTGIFLAFVIWYRHVLTQFLVCICSRAATTDDVHILAFWSLEGVLVHIQP